MNERKSVPVMIGDALREMAVWVIVFAPLDRWVEHRNYTWGDFGETFGISVLLFAFGAFLERI
jgi:hypothetical protein